MAWHKIALSCPECESEVHPNSVFMNAKGELGAGIKCPHCGHEAVAQINIEATRASCHKADRARMIVTGEFDLENFEQEGKTH